MVRTDEHGLNVSQSNPSGFGATDLQSAYALPPHGGANQIVALVDAYDNPNVESDLGVYRRQYGLPPCTTANGCFTKVNQRGAASPLPPTNTNWGTETALDVQMVSAACPECKILLVEADNDGVESNLAAAVQTAVNLGATFISNSWGYSEEQSYAAGDASNFNHPGVSIFASSGDYAYGVLYPSTSYYVTAVGGTSLSKDSSARGWSETAWSDAGSGCSAYIPKPPWQANKACSTRATADVSAVADPATGVAVYDSFGSGGWTVVGGTSVSSPLVAGIYAVTGNNGGQPWLSYYNTQPFNDITSGSNGSCGAPLCNAGTGWDGPTGNGTPDGTYLVRANRAQDGRIAAVSRDPGSMDVLYIGPDGSVNDARFEDRGSWSTTQVSDRLSASTTGRMTAVSRYSTSMDAFWIGPDASVWWASWQATAPNNWGRVMLAGPGSASVTGAITAASRSADSMELWYIGEDGSVQDKYYFASTGWKGFELAGPGSASTTGSISATARRLDTMEVWYIGADGSVQDKYFFNGAWNGFTLAPAGSAAKSGSISSVSRWPTAMELWYIGADGSVNDKYFSDSAGWNGLQLAAPGSASTTGSISATARGSNTMELWYVGADGSIQDKYFYNGSGWNSYELAGPGSADKSQSIASVARRGNTMEVWFGRTNESIQDEYWIAGSSWSGFALEGPGALP